MPSRTKNKGDWQREGERFLRKLCRTAQEIPTLAKRCQHSQNWHIDLAFLDSVKMAAMNEKFRKIPSPTDVLSFPTETIFYNAGFLGDILICLPILKRQAAQHGHSTRAELEILLTHGFLHLLGFDHERGPSEARAMKKWEVTLLKYTTGRPSLESLLKRNTHPRESTQS